MLYAEIAVHTDAPYRHPFTYSVPAGIELVPGQGVLVPFGQRTLQGVVISVSPTPTFEGDIRPLLSVAAELPTLPAHLLDLAVWMSQRYLAPLSASIALMLPPGVERRTRLVLRPTGLAGPSTDVARALLEALRDDPRADLSRLQRQLRTPRLGRLVNELVRQGALKRDYVLDPPALSPRFERGLRLLVGAGGGSDDDPLLRRLRDAGGTLPLSALRKAPDWSPAAHLRLIADGLIEEIELRVDRDPLAGQEFPLRSAPALTEAQSDALVRILNQQGEHLPRRAGVTLLHGVTGSGKTEVYLAAAAMVLRSGRRVLMLVPEIALTPQTIERFAGRFPGKVAVLHSALTQGQRYDQWWGVRDGRFDIVIGSRSAIFAPLTPLGLIIVDEEHEWTYKQEDRQPRYQTRDVAERLAALAGVPLVLGSATPDVTSYHRAERGRYQLVELPSRFRPPLLLRPEPRPEPPEPGARAVSRVEREGLPAVEVVDLSQELREGNRSIFSRRLSAALAATLENGEQAILFLNRRGSASFLLCRDCGHVPRCGRCALSLTFHAASNRLICHQCGRSRRVPVSCPRCGRERIRHVGLGTQRVEEEVRRRFPNARLLRWDRDTARRAADHVALFEQLEHGQADVLIGTQMVAKGLDLPRVTLVGIVNADLSLNLPEYYSGERAFQLFTQVAGRAGRRERRGLAILQTYTPKHYAVRAAATHDYGAFYRQEMEYRRRGGYPPFSRLTRLVFAHSSPRRAESETRRLAQLLRQTIADGEQAGSEVLGPVPCRAARIRGRWRWQLLLRCPRPQPLLRDMEFPAGWSIDVDPQAFS